MRLKIVRWLSEHDFRTLSYLDGSLTKICAKYKLKNGEAVVLTSRGWHRLRLVARMGDRSVMVIPESGTRKKQTPLEELARWVAHSMRDGTVMLNEFKAYQVAKREAA
jgi:hypothetical protein